MGALWGGFSTGYFKVFRPFDVADTKFLPTVGKSALTFAALLGVFSGTKCAMKHQRPGRDDWLNAFVGGAVSGAVISANSRNFATIAKTSLVVGVIGTAIHLNPLASKKDPDAL